MQSRSFFSAGLRIAHLRKLRSTHGLVLTAGERGAASEQGLAFGAGGCNAVLCNEVEEGGRKPRWGWGTGKK